uniref:Putative cd73 ecto-5'-nucleotidase n=1 Tax=Ixodes ricinus TaxID=34613 RepID=A0A6B0VD67_IXORI
MKTFCIFILVMVWGSAQCSSEGGFNITVLHTNDIHSRFLEYNRKGRECTQADRDKDGCFGGVARLLTKVKEIKKNNNNTFFFNGGDFFQGTVWYTVLKYNIVAEAMSRMMYDSVCLGNHEFDDGPEGLAPFLKRMEEAKVTVLGTNLDTSKEPLLNGTKLKKSITYQVEKLKIGVMGVVTKETMQIARPGKIEILDEITSIKQEVEELKKENVNFYVVISHVGFEMDKKIAAEVKELHLVVGGHTNTFLYTGKSPRPEDRVEGEYPTIVTRDSGKALVVQDYWAGKYLGHLQLEFDKEGKLKNWSGNPILMDNTTAEDTEMACVLDSYKEVVDNASKEYIGLTKVKLEASDKVCRIKECNTANLITDAFLAFYADRNTTNNTEDWSDVNAAVVNSGIAKTTVEQGVILRENMMAMMPYESTLYVLTMTGLQLTNMFEHGASKFTWFEDPEGAFLQASGIRVAFNFSLPKKCRVIKLDILCAKCKIPKYEPVMLNETYRIVTTSYIANGGDGFTFDESVKKETEGVVDNEVVIEYVRKMSPIKEPEEGRVIMYDNPRPPNSTAGLPIDAIKTTPKPSVTTA